MSEIALARAVAVLLGQHYTQEAEAIDALRAELEQMTAQRDEWQERYESRRDTCNAFERECERLREQLRLCNVDYSTTEAENAALRKALEHLTRAVGENYKPEIDVAYVAALAELEARDEN